MPSRILTPSAALVAAALTLLVAPAGFADTLLRARVRVDGSDPKSIAVTHTLDWSAVGGSPRSELAFYLASDVEVVDVRSADAVLTTRSEPVAGTTLKKWIVRLPVPLSAGATRSLTIAARVGAGAKGRGLQVAAKGGYFLPGSGWFPSLAPDSDEMTVHTTEFALPKGQRGIGCGGSSGSSWIATQPGRPYAAWGAYEFASQTVDGTDFAVWRIGAKAGPPARGAKLAQLIEAFSTAVGPASGSGAWKLVEVGGAMPVGGQRTLFWNEQRAAADPESITMLDRDLACALASSYWEEAIRFEGDYAVFASRGLARQLGDMTAATLDKSDDRWKTQALFLEERRSRFIASKAADRALSKLPLHAASTPTVVDGRGALVAHMAAEACPGLTYWVMTLSDFRTDHLGSSATWEKFASLLASKYPNQHTFLAPFLTGTDVPDFVLVSHAPSTEGSTGERYKVEVANRGKIAGPVDVAILTKAGQLVRSLRMVLDPGQSRSILFGDARRIGQIRLEHRAITPQFQLEKEEATVAPGANTDDTPFVPAFSFGLAGPQARRATDFSLALETVSINGFNGYVFVYETHHGPSGAVLVGEADVVITPKGAAAESFRSAMGKDHVSFRARDIFVRFPLDAWPGIEAQLRESVGPHDVEDLGHRRQACFEHSFPTGFNEQSRAQVPPPGGALVIFTLEGAGDWRGYIREPLPDGRVKFRLWDHLSRATIWESTL